MSEIRDPRVSRFDLHMHSTASSDGIHTPEELLTLSHEKGIGLFSITDHNTAEGAWHIARTCQQSGGLLFVPGIEFSSWIGEDEVHLLCYGIHPDDATILELVAEYRTNLSRQASARAEKLRQMGMRVDTDEVLEAAAGKGASGVTFLNVLKRYEENEPFIRPFISGEYADSPYTNFYFKMFARGGAAFVSVPLLDYATVVKRLRGRAVMSLAHPGLYPEELLKSALAHYPDGIEAYSSYHSPEKVQQFIRLAEREGMILTAGSDFHGESIKPGIHIGDTGTASPHIGGHFAEMVEELGGALFEVFPAVK